MAISTFSFFLPLPFFAAAGGFGGAAAFGAFGALVGGFGAPPAAPTRARVLLRSSIAASAERADMIASAALTACCPPRTVTALLLRLSLVLRAVTAVARAAVCRRRSH